MRSHDLIQRLFDVLAAGIAHRNPAAIALVAFMVWFWLRFVVKLLAPRPVSRRSHYEMPRAPARTLPRTTAAITRPAAPPRPRRPVDADGQPHPDYCPCTGCRAVNEAEAAARLPSWMPEPSADLAPVETACRHDQGVAPVVTGGVLLRYACANWKCDAVWPPDTRFPAGTVILDPEPEG